NSFITNATGTESVYDMINIFASSDPEDVETPTATIEGFNAKVDVSGSYFSCTQESEGLDTTFTVSQDITEDGQYYIYLDCRAAENMTVRAGETSVSSNPTEPHIVDLGYLYSGTSVQITVDTEMSCCGNFYLAKTDLAAMQMAFDRLADAQLEVTSYKEGKIKGTINNENDGLMFTSIPYDKGWTVKVDGEKVESICVGDALLAFEVPAGEHTVTMSYFPTGLIIGLVITLLCVFVLVVLCVTPLREKAEKILFPLLPKRQTSVYEEGEYVIYDDDFDGDFEDFEGFEDYEQSEQYGDDDDFGGEAEGASAESDD
ncbi:MAG: YfhO family protein, partial [Clostridia bacterium]|nr:YfhO family protein [Clostridia bacterium]